VRKVGVLRAATFSCSTDIAALVVFITSNDQGNQEMMLGCKERGIPAFGENRCLSRQIGTLPSTISGTLFDY
jgi:hypothetical protein